MKSTSIYKSVAGEQEVMRLYESALERWPVLCDRLNIATRQGDTFAIASGDTDAPPLLLLHGACSNAASWIGDVEQYSRHFRVYAIDTPGEPGKSAQNRPGWNGPAYAEWMEDILNALKIEKASIMGISQGGWIALKFAISRPERVEKLVLLSSGGLVPAKASFLLRAMAFSLFGKRGARAINRMTFGDQPIHEEAMKFMDAIMTHFKSRMGNLPLFSDSELRRLRMPELFPTPATFSLGKLQ